MSLGIRPAEDVDLFILDDQGIFFSESRQEIQLFNSSATFVWCCLADGRDLHETARAFAESFGASGQDAERHVVQAVHRWQGLGYLTSADLRSGGQAEQTTALEPQADLRIERKLARQQATPDPPPLDEAQRDPGERLGEASIRHSYCLLATRAQVRFSSPEQEAIVHPVLAHLETGADGEAGPILEVLSADSGHVVLADGALVGRCAGLDGLAPLVEGHLAQIAINAHRYFMQIHAGVVFDGEQCTLLPGPPGSGKSTLTAALVQSGFTYLSDEMALLEQPTFHARVLPFGITVKPGAVDLLSGWYPHLRDLPAHRRADDQVVRYLVPSSESLAADLDQSHPVGRLVFPRYEPTEPTSLRRIDRAQALHHLLLECMSLPEPIDAVQVRSLVSWMRSVACFSLSMSDLCEAVALVRQSE